MPIVCMLGIGRRNKSENGRKGKNLQARRKIVGGHATKKKSRTIYWSHILSCGWGVSLASAFHCN